MRQAILIQKPGEERMQRLRDERTKKNAEAIEPAECPKFSFLYKLRNSEWLKKRASLFFFLPGTWISGEISCEANPVHKYKIPIKMSYKDWVTIVR